MNDEQNEPIKEYAPTAYRSDQIPEQEAAPEGIDKGFSVKARLPWGSYLGINPTSYEFSENWYGIYSYAGESEYCKYSSISHRRRSYGLDKSSPAQKGCLWFILLVITGLFGFQGGGLVVLLISMSTAFFIFFATFDFYNSFQIVIWGLSISLFSTVYVFYAERKEIKNYKTNSSGGYERALIRENGMVTTAQGILPFYEFDPVLQASYSNTGGISHSLALRYRYPERLGVNLVDNPRISLGTSSTGGVADCYAAWDMWQRYMDVTQPLPDIPALEPFRALDPTTRAFDAAGKRDRPETYWRDLYASMEADKKARRRNAFNGEIRKASFWMDLLGFMGDPAIRKLKEAHTKRIREASWAGRPDLMELSVPNFRNSRTPEPEDVNVHEHLLKPTPKFVDRPEAERPDEDTK